jgi:hypothetical protein
VQTGRDSARPCSGFESASDLWAQIADRYDQLPREIEPEPGWFAAMAESCRAVAEELRRLAALAPPSAIADLAAWLRTHNTHNDPRKNDAHVPGNRSGRHRLH